MMNKMVIYLNDLINKIVMKIEICQKMIDEITSEVSVNCETWHIVFI